MGNKNFIFSKYRWLILIHVKGFILDFKQLWSVIVPFKNKLNGNEEKLKLWGYKGHQKVLLNLFIPTEVYIWNQNR